MDLQLLPEGDARSDPQIIGCFSEELRAVSTKSIDQIQLRHVKIRQPATENASIPGQFQLLMHFRPL